MIPSRARDLLGAVALYGSAALATQSTLTTHARDNEFNPLDYVDPFIGTANGGKY